MLVGESQVLQRDVHVREGHRKGARGRAAVAILPRQRQGRRAIARDAGGKRHAQNGPRREPDAFPERADRIEHGAGRARERAAVERNRVGGRAPAAEEARAVRLPFDGAAQARAVNTEDVEAHDRSTRRSRAAAG